MRMRHYWRVREIDWPTPRKAKRLLLRIAGCLTRGWTYHQNGELDENGNWRCIYCRRSERKALYYRPRRRASRLKKHKQRKPAYYYYSYAYDSRR